MATQLRSLATTRYFRWRIVVRLPKGWASIGDDHQLIPIPMVVSNDIERNKI
jgi:hypothetical protein